MSAATNPCCHSFSFRFAPSNSRFSIRVHLKPLLPCFPLNSNIHCVSTLSRRRRNKWEILCFRREESSPENIESKPAEEKLAEDLVATPEVSQSSETKKDWVSRASREFIFLIVAVLFKLRLEGFFFLLVAVVVKDRSLEAFWQFFSSNIATTENFLINCTPMVIEPIFVAKPWVVPWTVKTIVQVMLLWVASFWLIGSWIIPIIAHTAGYRKEFMTYRGQALYSLLTDVVEGLTGMAILHRCLSRFHPLPPGWFKFHFEGNWQFDVGLGCLMFPLINRLSQVNLNLLPILPSAPVTVSSVEQSIVARDPVAMALYAVVVSVCAPIWEEIVFRGFLLPSLTKYMPVWCSILVSSVAFALAHFNMQKMLPLILLGMVMGTVFARTRNLLPSMLLHSLWNAFVFLDLMR
ncbi:hypothetical protein SDJN02_02456 [Cucurbita argyrosperma subsp. argyrosperma]|nr:hypothetical protein SDJN02_02456 [Cucurbita argyrosperma subsp. argyrosperma]